MPFKDPHLHSIVFCINMHKGFCLFYPGCNENFKGEFFLESEHV